MGKINLKNYSFRAPQPDYRSGDILRRARLEQEQKDSRQSTGLVTSGWIEVQQGEGGYGWAVSSLIEFPYSYISRPIFTWGLDGTYSGNTHDSSGIPSDGVHATLGGNIYNNILPAALQALIDAEDITTWQPSIFVPRVVHWNMLEDTWFIGCYILVIQINPESTEVGKICRLHYQFTGEGV